MFYEITWRLQKRANLVIFERSESYVYSGFLSNATALKDFLILHCITIIQEIEGLLEVDKSPTCLYSVDGILGTGRIDYFWVKKNDFALAGVVGCKVPQD
jgi:hypothetical protein